jgi:hypothetical protein
MELLKELFRARVELVRATEVLMALKHAHIDPAVEAAARANRVRCFVGARFHERSPCTPA